MPSWWKRNQVVRPMSVSQLILVMSLTFWCSVTVTTGLQCFECLSLECDSKVICESIKVWMNRTLVPKRQYIEFNPSSKCPESNVVINSTEWTKLSQQCPKSDSVCLEAPIEVETIFNGLKQSLELDNHTKMKSFGIIRGCASRRFLLQLPEETIEVKEDMVNDTLPTAKEAVLSQKQGADDYTIHLIHSHHIYIDQGTEESVKCFEDNCNYSKRPKRNAAMGSGHYANLGLILLSCLFSYGVVFTKSWFG